MIQEITMYTSVCDNCEVVCGEDDGIIAWNEKATMRDVADNSDWALDGDKCYCPKCYSIDDDDNLIITKLSVRGNVLVDQSDKCGGENSEVKQP